MILLYSLFTPAAVEATPWTNFIPAQLVFNLFHFCSMFNMFYLMNYHSFLDSFFFIIIIHISFSLKKWILGVWMSTECQFSSIISPNSQWTTPIRCTQRCTSMVRTVANQSSTLTKGESYSQRNLRGRFEKPPHSLTTLCTLFLLKCTKCIKHKENKKFSISYQVQISCLYLVYWQHQHCAFMSVAIFGVILVHLFFFFNCFVVLHMWHTTAHLHIVNS